MCNYNLKLSYSTILFLNNAHFLNKSRQDTRALPLHLLSLQFKTGHTSPPLVFSMSSVQDRTHVSFLGIFYVFSSRQDTNVFPWYFLCLQFKTGHTCPSLVFSMSSVQDKTHVSFLGIFLVFSSRQA